MIKKNRHRAGRKKRERILRAQQRAALELEASNISLNNLNRPTVLVLLQEKEPLEPKNLTPEPEVPIIDLTEEDSPFFVEKNNIELLETNNK